MKAPSEEDAIEQVRALHPSADVIEAFDTDMGWRVFVYTTADQHGRDTVGDDSMPNGETAKAVYDVEASE